MQRIKELFFSESLRHWHFENLIRQSNLSRERVNYFLKLLLKEGLVMRVKPRGKMPYYVANRDSFSFREQKRLFGLNELVKSGLFEYINAHSEIKTAIVFGSFARGDWNKSSDVDIFIYGSTNFDKQTFENRLGHEIQLFSFELPKELKNELEPGLILNIIKGFNVKGTLEPFEVSIT